MDEGIKECAIFMCVLANTACLLLLLNARAMPWLTTAQALIPSPANPSRAQP